MHLELPDVQITQEMQTALDATLKALAVFVQSDNEHATSANNDLQRLAGEARKAVMGDAIKKAPKAKK